MYIRLTEKYFAMTSLNSPKFSKSAPHVRLTGNIDFIGYRKQHSYVDKLNCDWL